MTATAALETRAEIVKLARLLGRDEASLEYLEAAAADDLRALRIQATDVLFDADRAVLDRLAAASRRLPAGLVATIGRRVFGPLLCARTAGILDPKHAIDLAGRLDTPFLADIAVELDPRRASDVIGGMPTARSSPLPPSWPAGASTWRWAASSAT